MDGLSARLRSLAAIDAARTDPADPIVERGWQRVSAAIAAPVAAGVGTASTAAAAAATKKVLGVLALAVLGLGGAASIAAPVDVAISQPAIAAMPSDSPPRPVAETPRPSRPVAPAPIEAAAVAPEPAPPVAPTPAPSSRARPRAAPDTLAEQVRALGLARRDLDGGRARAALKAARKLLRDPESQVAPEARAIEAIAACTLRLSEGPELAAAFARRHPSSPLRGRVAGVCGRSR